MKQNINTELCQEFFMGNFNLPTCLQQVCHPVCLLSHYIPDAMYPMHFFFTKLQYCFILAMTWFKFTINCRLRHSEMWRKVVIPLLVWRQRMVVLIWFQHQERRHWRDAFTWDVFHGDYCVPTIKVTRSWQICELSKCMSGMVSQVSAIRNILQTRLQAGWEVWLK